MVWGEADIINELSGKAYASLKESYLSPDRLVALTGPKMDYLTPRSDYMQKVVNNMKESLEDKLPAYLQKPKVHSIPNVTDLNDYKQKKKPYMQLPGQIQVFDEYKEERDMVYDQAA